LNKFIWLFLTVLCLVLAWVAESQMLAWTSCFFVFTLLLSRLLVAFPPPLEATRVLSTSYAYPGDKIHVWVRLRLKRRPLTWLMLNDASPPLPVEREQGLLLPPGAKKTWEFNYTLRTARRGYYSLGPLVLRYSDPFGFFESRRVVLPEDKVTVFPALKEMTHRRLPQVQASGEILAMRRAFEDYSRPAGIRDYRQGDSLRRIHWRATAHTGRPQSKVYDISASLCAVLLLNLHRPDYPAGPAETVQASELACSLTASLAIHLLAAGQRVGLAANGFDPKTEIAASGSDGAGPVEDFPEIKLSPGRGPERPLEVLSLLGRLQLSQSRTLAGVLQGTRPDLSWGDVLFVITPSVDLKAIGELTALEHTGFSIFVLIVGDSPLAAQAQWQCIAAGIAAERVILESDIPGIFA
jgi:uncharacterized protein (DUF58 family)